MKTGCGFTLVCLDVINTTFCFVSLFVSQKSKILTLFQEFVMVLNNKVTVIVSSSEYLLLWLVIVCMFSFKTCSSIFWLQTWVGLPRVIFEVCILQTIGTLYLPTPLATAITITKKVRCSMQPGIFLINKCTTSFNMKVGVLFLHGLLLCFNCNTLMFTTVLCSCIAELKRVRRELLWWPLASTSYISSVNMTAFCSHDSMLQCRRGHSQYANSTLLVLRYIQRSVQKEQYHFPRYHIYR